MTHLSFRSILSIFLFLLTSWGRAQQWKRVQLPGDFESIMVAGNVTVPGMLALATTSPVYRDKVHPDRGLKSWRFFTSPDAGDTWLLIDSGSFYHYLVDPLDGIEGWTQIVCADSTITRLTYWTWWEGHAWRCSVRSGNTAFSNLRFPGESDFADDTYKDAPCNMVGVPVFFPTSRGTLISARPARHGCGDGAENMVKVSMHELRPSIKRWVMLADTTKGILTLNLPDRWSSWRNYDFLPAASFGPPVLLALSTLTGLYYSSDSSETWTRSAISDDLIYSFPSQFFSYTPPFLVHPSDSRLLYGALEFKKHPRSLMRSTDGCETWTRVLDQPVTAVAVSLFAPSYIAAVKDRTPYLSSDRGDSWHELAPLPEGCTWLLLDSDEHSLRLLAANDHSIFVCKLATPAEVKNLGVSISPHPMQQGRSSKMQIQSGPYQPCDLEVFDALGRRCGSTISAVTDAGGTAFVTLDPRALHLTRGSYQVQVRTGDMSTVLPLVVVP